MRKCINVCQLILLVHISLLFCMCQQPSQTQTVNIDSLVNARIEASKAEIEARAQREAEERMRHEAKERARVEQENRKVHMESVRPSGNSLRDREMRYYYDQGYDFGSHSTFSRMDDEWMHNAFLLVVSYHDMSHAGNETLLKSFMAGVAQGRKELRDLQTY